MLDEQGRYDLINATSASIAEIDRLTEALSSFGDAAATIQQLLASIDTPEKAGIVFSKLDRINLDGVLEKCRTIGTITMNTAAILHSLVIVTGEQHGVWTREELAKRPYRNIQPKAGLRCRHLI